MIECFDKVMNSRIASTENKQQDDVSICFSVRTQVPCKSEVRAELCTEHSSICYVTAPVHL